MSARLFVIGGLLFARILLSYPVLMLATLCGSSVGWVIGVLVRAQKGDY